MAVHQPLVGARDAARFLDHRLPCRLVPTCCGRAHLSVQVYVRERSWGAALELCAAHGLDADEVHKARWASRPVDAANIQDSLARMADRWVGRVGGHGGTCGLVWGRLGVGPAWTVGRRALRAGVG